jgi:hypothetical protein
MLSLNFCNDRKLTGRRQLIGSRAVARETIAYFIAAVEFLSEQQSSFDSLIGSIQNLGRQLEEASPKGSRLSFVETLST